MALGRPGSGSSSTSTTPAIAYVPAGSGFVGVLVNSSAKLPPDQHRLPQQPCRLRYPGSNLLYVSSDTPLATGALIAFLKSGDLFVPTDSGTAVYSFNTTNGTLNALSGSPVAGSNSGLNNNLTAPVAAQ